MSDYLNIWNSASILDTSLYVACWNLYLSNENLYRLYESQYSQKMLTKKQYMLKTTECTIRIQTKELRYNQAGIVLEIINFWSNMRYSQFLRGFRGHRGMLLYSERAYKNSEISIRKLSIILIYESLRTLVI